MARFNRTSGKGGSLLDNGVAALAAVSAGFVIYAMPDALFSRIVVASRLPRFLAAAQPPLGMTARLAVIAAAALLVYALVWSLLRALDAIGGGKSPAAAAEEEAPAPRLRRADAHPDAPSRRPILAGRDLGEPGYEPGYDEEPLELAPEAALLSEAEPEPEPELEPEPEPAFEPEPEAPSEPLPAFLVPQEPETAAAEEPAPVAAEEPAPAAFAEDGFAGRFSQAEEDEAGEEEEEGEEEEGGEGGADDQSLSRLMQRFESGLGRKQQALDAAPPAAVAQPEPEPEPEPQERVGHRLRSAISDLNKIAAPGR